MVNWLTVTCVLATWAAIVSSIAGDAPSQSPVEGPTSGKMVDCSTLIYNMMDCMPFLSGGGGETAVPGDQCCSGFKTVINANAECICYALGSATSLGLHINMTRAAALPSACRVSAPPISNCNVSLSPGGSSPVSLSPSESPANPPAPAYSSAPPSNSPSHPPITEPPAATLAPTFAPGATPGTTMPPSSATSAPELAPAAATSAPVLAPAAATSDTTMPPDSQATTPPPEKAGAYSIAPAFLVLVASLSYSLMPRLSNFS